MEPTHGERADYDTKGVFLMEEPAGREDTKYKTLFSPRKLVAVQTCPI